MDPKKIKIIQKWPQLKNLHELRSFIGMCCYYRRFKDNSTITIGLTLHDLTKKQAKFQWTTRQNSAFNELKQRLMI